jgi:hypothetical protein
MLYGTNPLDRTVFAQVTVSLSVVAALACRHGAHRASTRCRHCEWNSGHCLVRENAFIRDYSVRRACMGFNREARHAGTMQAAPATRISSILTSRNTAGSSGRVSYSIERTSRTAATLPAGVNAVTAYLLQQFQAHRLSELLGIFSLDAQRATVLPTRRLG